MSSRSFLSNKRLSQITFVTSVGDFLTLLASLKLLHMLTGSTLFAGYVLAARSLGTGLGSFLYPRIVRSRGIERLLGFSELTSGILSLSIIGSMLLGAPPWLFLVLFGLQQLSKQQFTLARDTYSKLCGTTASHRGLTAQIVGSYYGAALIGSILAYFSLSILHPKWLFAFDALTFAISAFFCFGLETKHVTNYKLSILRPLQYLRYNPQLLSIFLIRSIAIWIPIAIFNYLLYTLTDLQYHVDIVANGWTYVATACGSVLASFILGPKLRIFARHHDAVLAAIGSFLIGVTRLGLLAAPTFVSLLLVIFVAGIFNGSNMIASQTILKRVASESEFAEVSALEQVISRSTDFVVTSLFAILISRGVLTYSGGIIVSAVTFWIVAALYLAAPFKAADPIPN